MVQRYRISTNARLFVTSSDESVATVALKPKYVNYSSTAPLPKLTNQLDSTLDSFIQITGKKGTGGVKPNTAKIEVRYGGASKSDPIVAELTVYVFTRLDVNVIPHEVTIQGPKGLGTAPKLDYAEAFKTVKAVWQPSGIFFFVGDRIPGTVKSNSGEADRWKYPGYKTMINGVGHHIHDSNALNIYFVKEIIGTTAGFAALPSDKERFFHGGAMIVETDGHTPETIGNIMAHEIGHHLGLDHTDNLDSDHERKDLWAQRMMMRPISTPGVQMISMKNLYDKEHPKKNHITDPEWSTARKWVLSPPMTYKEYLEIEKDLKDPMDLW
jgi:hypothetical protein